MRNKEIKVELLKDISAKDFEPYGQIIGRGEGKPLEDFPYLLYWPIPQCTCGTKAPLKKIPMQF